MTQQNEKSLVSVLSELSEEARTVLIHVLRKLG